MPSNNTVFSLDVCQQVVSDSRCNTGQGQGRGSHHSQEWYFEQPKQRTQHNGRHRTGRQQHAGKVKEGEAPRGATTADW